MTCRCGEQIVKSVDGKNKIRSKITIIDGNSMSVICKGCNSEVKIPLTVQPIPTLYVKK